MKLREQIDKVKDLKKYIKIQPKSIQISIADDAEISFI